MFRNKSIIPHFTETMCFYIIKTAHSIKKIYFLRLSNVIQDVRKIREKTLLNREEKKHHVKRSFFKDLLIVDLLLPYGLTSNLVT